MSFHDYSVTALDGTPLDLATFRGQAALVVNVASRCGLTPQYEGLQQLYDRYKDRGFTIVGVPCNQFGEQEPASPDEIASFCSASYGVSFPLTSKLEVNGRRRHELYQELTVIPDSAGKAGDVEWNFEKFLISPEGQVIARFRPLTPPDADELISAVESALPA
jgi:glutathione peroxidase